MKGQLLVIESRTGNRRQRHAGFRLSGSAAELSRDEQLAMIDLNVRALTELSLAFVESLERHRGGILNVASIAGFLPGPGMAVYYATKAYVLSFSVALHRELAPPRSAGHHAVPGAGADRIPGAIRDAHRYHPEIHHPAGATRGADRLSRLDARQTGRCCRLG